jgi:DNA polymerase III subunit delta
VVDYSSFLRGVERGDVGPIVLLHGPEPILIEDAIDRLARHLFGEGGESVLDRENVDLREAGAEALVRAARTLPFLAPRRLVVARMEEAPGEKAGAPLLAYVGDPGPTTVLVLVVERGVEPTHWLAKALPPTAVVAVQAPVGRALTSWLRTRAQRAGLELSDDGAELLVELVGDDPGLLWAEVEKAAVAGGPDNRRVGPNEVRAVVGDQRVHKLFELMRAIEAGDRSTALTVLQRLLDSGEEPLVLLAMLVRDARLTWQVKEARRHGRSAEEIARTLRRPPAAAAALVTRADSMQVGDPPRRLRLCWETDRRLKLGANARGELILLVIELCGV